MKRARTYLLALGLAAAAAPALAQDSSQDEDRGFLTGLIEDNLSTEGQVVRLDGFEGALSSRATFERLTIADRQGVWLTISDGAISWNRAALLRGAVKVAELSAASIEIARAPQADPAPGIPEPAAQPFRLPDLPVSVEIDTIAAQSVHLGAPIIGAEVTVRLDGGLSLVDGDGTANLRVERIDGTSGTVALSAEFANATEHLALDLSLSEPKDGIAATLLNLPGRPAMDLAIKGEGPLSDFSADLSLASDGEPRLTGTARLTGDGATPPARSFALDLAGDLAPLFLPDFRPFFGPDVRLSVQGSSASDGMTRLDRFAMSAAALTANGSLTLAPDGLPRNFSIDARIAAPDGGRVRLPASGAATELDNAQLSLNFDASRGDAWQGTASLNGLSLGEDRLGQATLQAEGVIARDPAGRRVTAHVRLQAAGLAPADPALAGAVGETLDATTDLTWQEGAPLDISNLLAQTATARLRAAGTIGALDEGLPFTLQGALNLPDLSAFAGLAGRPLGGRVVASVNGNAHLLDGRFDMRAAGIGRDLSGGIEPLDRLLVGQSSLALDARRDESGIVLRRLDLDTDHARMSAEGTFAAGATDASLAARIDDAVRALPQLSGPAAIRAQIRETAPGRFAVDASAEGPGAASVAFAGALIQGADKALSADGRLTAGIRDLAAYASLTRRPLKGALDLTAEGSAALADTSYDLKLNLSGNGLALGVAQLDGLLSGRSSIALDARGDDTSILLRRLDVIADKARISASGSYGAGATDGTLTARLDDTALVFPEMSGPATVDAKLRETAPGRFAVDASAQGPGDASVAYSGALNRAADGAFSGEGRLTAAIRDLAAYAGLARRPLKGALDLTAEGSAAPAENRYDLTVEANGNNVALGEATIDRLLGGRLKLSADADQNGDTTTVSRFQLETGEVTADASGSLSPGGGSITGKAGLRNLAVLAPDFPGALGVTGSVTRTPDGRWGTDLDATDPGGTTAKVSGTLAADASTADLALKGEVPLGLANSLLVPRAIQGRARFDLRLAGPPGLAALAGRITTSGARLVDPNFGVSLVNIAGNVDLSGARAAIDLSGAVEGGGNVAVAGGIGLDAPNPADIRVTLANARLTDPQLYETRVSGALSLTGPLTNGGIIGGTIDLGETEIRVAATGLGTGEIPDGMRHVNESAAGRQTRANAGLLGGPPKAGGGRPLGLDLLIRAPNRIFVRGRGLDAELGGALRLMGTTDNILPQGQFDMIRGRLDILGRRLAFTEGMARLEGSFDPTIRFVATSQAEDVDVSVIVEGSASEPQIHFTSSPELPEDEVLAHLVFGRALGELSALQAAQLASAVATLTGRGGGGLVGRLRKQFGLDDFDVTTGEDGNAALRAGRYISDKVYSEVMVDSEGQADISINLDLSRSLTVKGTAGSDGETGLGIFFQRDY